LPTVPNATVGNDVLSGIVLSGGQSFSENNFGEASILPEYLSIVWFFASSDSPTTLFRETIAVGEEMAGNTNLAASIRAGGTDVPVADNFSPVAVGDSFTVVENSTFSAPLANGVLSNDTDADGDTLTAVLLSTAANGSVTLNGNGTFTYTPTTDFSGTDSFTYQASDGTNLSNSATVTITVTPTATVADNTFTLAENSPAGTVVGTLTPLSGLGNDIVFSIDDPNLDPLLELAADDHISGNPAGSVVLIEYVDFQCPICATFHPQVEQLETDFADDLVVITRHFPLESIHLNARAAAIASEAASRQGAFAAVGDILFDRQNDWNALSDPQSTFESYATELGLDLTQFRSDQADSALQDRVDRDLDAIATLGGTGTPTFYLNGQFISNPASLDAFASLIEAEIDATNDAFQLNRQTGQITVRDAALLDFETTPEFSLAVNAVSLNGSTASLTATINLTNVNETAPTAVTDSYSLSEGGTRTVDVANGVLSNDSDADGDTLTAQLVTSPTNGTISFNANGSFTYTPNTNFSGTDSFTYAASDGSLSDNATVSLTVTPVADAPEAVADTYAVNPDETLTVNVSTGVLANDSDADGDALDAQVVTSPTNGSLTLNANGSFTYVPNSGFTGTDTFTYQASDGTLNSAATVVTIDVSAVDLIGIRLETTTPDGTIVNSVAAGDAFILNVYAADLRSTPQGVFSIYSDLNYDESLVAITGNLAFGAALDNGIDGDTTTAGLIDELGAFAGSISPPGVSESLLVSIPMQATAVGSAQFSTDPADNLPFNDAGLFGLDDDVTSSQISFGTAVLEIVAQGAAEGEAASQSAFAADVDTVFADEDDWLSF